MEGGAEQSHVSLRGWLMLLALRPGTSSPSPSVGRASRRGTDVVPRLGAAGPRDQGRATCPEPGGRVHRSPRGPRRCPVRPGRAASGPGGAPGSRNVCKRRAENAVEGRWKRAPPGAGRGQGIAPASAPQPPPRRDAGEPRGLAAAPRGCCRRLARSVAAGSRKSCPSPVLWNGSWAAGSASKNVEQCRGQPKSHFLLAPRTFPGDSSLAEAGKFAASALDKIQTVAAKTVPSPGRGGGGLSSPAGHAAGLAFPLREGAVSWKSSRYRSCLNSASSLRLRRVKKKKDGARRDGDRFALGGLRACPRPGSRGILG